jgi:hypothetical protein
VGLLAIKEKEKKRKRDVSPPEQQGQAEQQMTLIDDDDSWLLNFNEHVDCSQPLSLLKGMPFSRQYITLLLL